MSTSPLLDPYDGHNEDAAENARMSASIQEQENMQHDDDDDDEDEDAHDDQHPTTSSNDDAAPTHTSASPVHTAYTGAQPDSRDEQHPVPPSLHDEASAPNTVSEDAGKTSTERSTSDEAQGADLTSTPEPVDEKDFENVDEKDMEGVDNKDFEDVEKKDFEDVDEVVEHQMDNQDAYQILGSVDHKEALVDEGPDEIAKDTIPEPVLGMGDAPQPTHIREASTKSAECRMEVGKHGLGALRDW